MTAANESLGQQSEMRALLDAGLEELGGDQTVVFTLYSKVVVSNDGFVFWVATPETMTVKGSLHIATDRMQDEDQTIGANQVILSSEQLITAVNTLSPGNMWIGSWPVAPQVNLQVAFAQRGSFYREAELFHYSGYAVYPALSSQLIQNASDLPAGPIVSNSTPIWLSLTTFAGLTVPVYPSFLVPDNIVPPYIVAHVEPSATEVLQNFPIFFWPGVPIANSGTSQLEWLQSSQLSRDEVDLTLYGFTNAMAIQYLQSLIDFSMVGPGEPPTFGFANAPAIRDAKRVQVEIAAIAMKKTLHISANYYQSTAEATARRLILSAGFSSFVTKSVP